MSLYDSFPPVGTLPTSTGPQEVPYRLKGGTGHILVGHTDLDAARRVLAGDPELEPVTYVADGKEVAVASLWFMNDPVSSCGEYQEFVVCFYVAEKEQKIAQLGDAPHSAPEALLMLSQDNKYSTFIWRLWLDSDAAIAYGNDILGYLKQKFTPIEQAKGFEITDGAFKVAIESKDGPLVEANLPVPTAVQLPAPAADTRPPIVITRLASPAEFSPVRRTGRATSFMSVTSSSSFCRWEAHSGAELKLSGEIAGFNFVPRMHSHVPAVDLVFYPPTYPNAKTAAS